MTKQVRTSYRHHRKATLGVATVLAVAIAAVVIPLANAAEKTYTLTVNPATLCANASGGASTVVTLRNTGSPQTAGSAEVYFPAGSVQSVSGGGWQLDDHATSSASNGTKDIVALNNLEHGSGTDEDGHRFVQELGELLDSDDRCVEAVEPVQRLERHGQPVHGPRHIPEIAGGAVRHRLRPRVPGSQPRLRLHHGDGAFDDSDLPKAAGP